MSSGRRLAAIMFTDLVGSTAAAQQDEKAALDRQLEQEKLLRPIFGRHGGREIKSTGDGFLVEFDSALRATEAAIEAQRALRERNTRDPSRPLLVRIGIHLGDVERRNGDIFGDAVNIAARVEPYADPGGICLSEPVVTQVRNKIPVELEKLGARTLKGVQDPLEIYRVVLVSGRSDAGNDGPQPPRLAVLPFANISPDPKDAYFADGLTEEIIAALSQIRGLRVISRTSVNHYKDTSKPVPQIGMELGVESVLEGSVRKAGDQLRITVQLIDTRTDDHRWAQTYDRKLENVFAIQAEVAEHTAGALRLELLGSDRAGIRRGPTSNLEAYELYLKGVAAFLQTADEGWSRRGTEAAAGFFEAAIAKDPGFAMAHSYYANLLIAAMGESLSGAEASPRIRELVARALELDPTSADARTARGNLALQIELDWATAEREFRRAIELNPSYMPAHAWYGILLYTLGRFEESLRQFRAAAELDPLFQNLEYWQLNVRRDSGDLEGAAAVGEQALERHAGNRALHVLLGQVYALLGRLDDARKEAEMARGPADSAFVATGRAALLALLGDPSEARQLVEGKGTAALGPGRYVRPGYLARVLVALGEHDRALDLLESDGRGGYPSLWIDYPNYLLNPIRDHPRFAALLRRMNLPTAPAGPTIGKAS